MPNQSKLFKYKVQGVGFLQLIKKTILHTKMLSRIFLCYALCKSNPPFLTMMSILSIERFFIISYELYYYFFALPNESLL